MPFDTGEKRFQFRIVEKLGVEDISNGFKKEQEFVERGI